MSPLLARGSGRKVGGGRRCRLVALRQLAERKAGLAGQLLQRAGDGEERRREAGVGMHGVVYLLSYLWRQLKRFEHGGGDSHGASGDVAPLKTIHALRHTRIEGVGVDAYACEEMRQLVSVTLLDGHEKHGGLDAGNVEATADGGSTFHQFPGIVVER